MAAQTQATKQLHDILVIDEICHIIRMKCAEQELVRLITAYQIEEAKIMNMQQDQLVQQILKQQQEMGNDHNSQSSEAALKAARDL